MNAEPPKIEAADAYFGLDSSVFFSGSEDEQNSSEDHSVLGTTKKKLKEIQDHIKDLGRYKRQIGEILGQSTDITKIQAKDINAMHDVTKDAYAALRAVSDSCRDLHLSKLEQKLGKALTQLRGTVGVFKTLSMVSSHLEGEVGEAIERFGRFAPVAQSLVTNLSPLFNAIEQKEKVDLLDVTNVVLRVDVREVLTALGFEVPAQGKSLCESDAKGAGCWAERLIEAFRGAIDVDHDSLKVQGPVFAAAVASMGDQFHSRNEWHWFFHLTVGVGMVAAWNVPGEVTGTGDTATRKEKNLLAPLIAEQIGGGLGSPTWKALTLKLGACASGLLYRAVLDTKESDAFFLTSFVALDINEALELYIAPGAIIYPPDGPFGTTGRFMLSFGAQVPLGDYLTRVVSK